jgi:Cu+-exporting ATPase
MQDTPTVVTRDPVCGMTVDPAKAKHRFDYEGQTYLFCCGGCRTAFESNPQAFLKKDAGGAAPAGATAQPMTLHPGSPGAKSA